ncbi:MAG: phosphotransferase [Clostridia bacterium]|nr:phosphotransferase [Clostridia bacterium]
MEKLTKLCPLLQLGEVIAPPAPVSGGLLHKMFRVETARGVFAVKRLNPEVMMRPGALNNMRTGEAANAAFEGFAAFDVCASMGGVTQVEGSYFIVYPWVEGRSVFPPEITAEHCRVMGHVLGSIHQVGVHIPGMEREMDVRSPFDWSMAGDARLPRWDAAAREGLRRLRGVQVVSHRDLDPKNVMWQGMRPCVIDWEAAGYVNPWQELIELLNYWADDEEKARAMIAAYEEHIDLTDADWEAALAAGMDGMLGWLHYCLNRPGGEEQAANTLKELERYEERAAFLRRLLA